MLAMGVRRLVATTVLFAALVFVFASTALAEKSTPQAVVALPAAGELTVPKVVARAAPSATAASVHVLKQFRPDFRPQEVLAVGATVGADGQLWYRLSLPMRPNNTYGWVSARQLQLHHVATRILINVDKRRLQVLRGNKVLYTTTVAVGRPGMETPLGHYYVQVRFHPDDSFLGVFAFETSAYSKLTDWPGGGVVGIHGTSMPQLLGQAVSHGCVRMSNEAALVLKKLVPLGTPITIVQH
jgi:lipoprotein-anchoring transpeptidase ErfK/SrfK